MDKVMRPPRKNKRYDDDEEREKYPAIKEWNLPKVPRDAEGFVQSFEMNQVDEYKKFFDDYGFVVVNHVLTQDQVNETVDEIWEEMERKSKDYSWYVIDLIFVDIRKNDYLSS